MDTRTAVIRCLGKHLDPWDEPRPALYRLCKAVLDSRVNDETLLAGDELQIEMAVGPGAQTPEPGDPYDDLSETEIDQEELRWHVPVLAVVGLAEGKIGSEDAVDGVWWLEDDHLADCGITYADVRAVACGHGYRVAAGLIIEALELSA